MAGGPAGRFSFKKTTSDLLSHDAAAPGGRERARGPPTGVRGGGTPAPARVAVCCGHLLRDAPRAAPNAAAAAGRAACVPRARRRAGSRGPPPYRGGRGARAEVPAFMISGGLIKYISCVGDELTTLIAGRRRTRPHEARPRVLPES